MSILIKNGRLFVSILILAAVLCIPGCTWIKDGWNSAQRQNENTPGIPPQNAQSDTPFSVHLAFGNPSNATMDTENADNYLIVSDGSAFSYNNSRGTVNWISWRTTRSDLGESIPRPDFRPDPRLPYGFKTIGPYDYTRSGYDRGHMIPSADRFANAGRNEDTFMMTNIVPQTGALNQYPWEKLESHSRSQARRGFDVYTIAGVYGDQGTIKGKITIPTHCWKIIAFLPRGRALDSIDLRTRIVAVDMPNRDGLDNHRWEKYKTTAREIEEKTGFDFFAWLPRDTQDQMETRKELSNIMP